MLVLSSRREGADVHEPAAQLLMVGVCHRSATLAELGRLGVRRDALPEALAAVVSLGFGEVVVLSTCSRTEVYVGSSGDTRAEAARLVDAVAGWSGVSRSSLEDAAGVRSGADAVAHLFRVTSGLESRLVGDVDVLAQVRTAWRAARIAGSAGPLLSRLFPAAIRCAQQVHEQTALGREGRSLARRAVEVGLTRTTRARPDVLVVGSGQMAKVACEHLSAAGLGFRVAARDQTYAARLAGGAQRVCPLPELVDGVRGADLLICATSASHHVLTVRHVRAAMAGRERPLTVVDLAVPGNVDTAVADLVGVQLVDLGSLGDEGPRDPRTDAALAAATGVVDAAVRRWCDDLAAAQAGPVIRALRARVEQTCLDELRRHGATEDHDALTRAAHAVAGKVLHRPTMLARSAAAAGDRAALLLLCQAFDVPLDPG